MHSGFRPIWLGALLLNKAASDLFFSQWYGTPGFLNDMQSIKGKTGLSEK